MERVYYTAFFLVRQDLFKKYHAAFTQIAQYFRVELQNCCETIQASEKFHSFFQIITKPFAIQRKKGYTKRKNGQKGEVEHMKEKETTNAMSCPTKSPEASARWKMILSGVIFLVLVVAVTILMIPVMRLMMQEGGKEQLIEKIQSYGIFAPLLFVLLQVIQIVVAFIPGGPIPMIGGAVFGMVPGILLSLAGSFLGTAIVYYLVQWIGRPLLNLFVKEEHLERFAFLKNRRKMERIVFLLFLCPGLPKDALTYIVAFNKTIPPLPLFFLTTIARFPAMALTVKMGSSLWEGNWKMVALVVGILILIAAAGGVIRWYHKKRHGKSL